MPRRPRVFVSGGVCHVYSRVARGERVFGDGREAAGLVEVLREVKREHGLSVLAWCVMATHYHLAVRVGRVPLWRSMRLIQGRFARSYNRRHRLMGPFWQGRYKAIVVPDVRDLQQLIAYIHLNPVATKVVSDPARYRWSGHRELVGRVADPLVDVDEALVLFGRRRKAALRAYVRVLRGERREAWIGEGPGRLPWWGRVDDEAVDGSAWDVRPAVGAGAGTQRVTVRDVDAFIRRAGEHLGVSGDVLGSRGKALATVRAREIIAIVGVERFGVKVNNLAGRLGKNPGSVSRWIVRAGQRRGEDRGFAACCRRLEAALTKNPRGSSARS
jgi:REP element-mobilizing transposase RayT